MPTYALGHVAAAATEIQTKDLTIVGHTKAADASPSAPHITTLLPAIDRERNDAIAVSEAITIDGRDLSVGLWYLKEDTTAATIDDFAKLPGGSDGTAQNTPRIFDSIGDVDNESFVNGEVIMTRSEGEGAVSWIFELGATEGDYELADAVSGYFNKLRNQTQSIVLEPDGGTDEVVSFSQQDDNFGDFTNDLDPTAKFYYVRRDAASTAVQSFESGVTTVIPADDFDWYFFRRIDNATVEFMGKPFTSSEVYGTVASKEIGALKQVPNVKEDGSAKVNKDYVDAGLLPLVNGYRLTDGATSNPKFALMFPTFVSGDDLLVPNTFSGDFVRNLGGDAEAFMAFQDHALQDHDHRVKTNSNNSGATASTNNARAGWNGLVWDSSPGVGTNGFEAGANVDNETRPANFAMQFCLVLDSYSRVLMVDPTLAEVEDGRVEIPVGDTSIISTAWSLTDLGFDPSTESGRLILESDLADISIELPMAAGKTYFSGIVGDDPAWQIRATHQGGNNLGIATGRVAADGGTTTLNRVWYYPPSKTVIRREDLVITNPGETDLTTVLQPNGDGTATFKPASIDYHQGHQVEFEVTGEFFDGKQVFGMGWDAPFSDTMLSSDFQLIPAGVVGYYVGMKGTVRTDTGYLIEGRNEDNGTNDTWRMGQTTPNGAFIIRQLTNTNRPFAAGTTYYNQKFTILYVKP